MAGDSRKHRRETSPLTGWMKGAGRLAVLSCAALFPSVARAHDVSEQARQSMLDGNWVDAIRIGAEHMLTGYDHLLFLLGVLFFLSGFWQIVRFITAFTLGHTLTLLFATLNGITANAYLIDAVIALTVCYKAFENLGGFQRLFGTKAPNLLYMVFVFGLIHGFGLSTRLQQLTLMEDPELVSKILGFNAGVELGQVAALAFMMGVVHLWRGTEAWGGVTRTANVALLAAGLVLFGLQIGGFLEAGASEPAPAIADVSALTTASMAS